jgi:uncharacterized protein (UPF0332 family)
MDFRAYVVLAEALVSGGTEAEWRTAISRAYYGAFHVGCDLLTTLGFAVPRNDRAHAAVILRLSNSADDAVIESGRSLSTLRTLRNRADYEKRQRISARDADNAVDAVHEIIGTLDDALSEPTRSHITDAIKKYERDVLKEVTWRT